MKHLIMACYFFPPGGGAGAQRPLAITRHAASNGWRVTVVTRQQDSGTSIWDPRDDSLKADNEHTRIVHVPIPEDSLAARMVPPQNPATDPWVVSMVEQIRKTHESDPADAFLLTMPPYGMCGILEGVRESLPQVPRLVDLRDPWALDGAFPYSSASQWRQNRQAMQNTFAASNGVIANTPEAGKLFLENTNDLRSEQLAVVPNGYEDDDFPGDKPSQPQGYEQGKFHLVHTGTLHSKTLLKRSGLIGWLRSLKSYRAEPVDVSGRTPKHLLDAINRLRDAGDPSIEKLKLVLVGVEDGATTQLVRSAGLEDVVQVTGYLPHDQSLAWLQWADCLFLPLHGLPPGHRSRIVPGKTYEYLASGKPIVGALPEGDARDLVAASERGFLADPCDAKQLAAALSAAHKSATQAASEPPPLDWVKDYRRSVLTRRLFEFIDQTC